MLDLETRLTLDAETLRAANLTSRFSEDDLKRLGQWVWQGYDRDVQSRSRWTRRTEAAMDLAMQLQRAKSFPWINCSNVSFPLITVAVLQFHALAYPAIIQGTDVAKYRVIGEDSGGDKAARAARIGTHMSWQLLEGDPDWEEGMDEGLINYAVVGDVFKKSYHDYKYNRLESDVVLAKDLVFSYWAKSIEACPRKTHRITLFKNDIYEGVRRGIYRDVLAEPWYQIPMPNPANTVTQANADTRAGKNQPENPDEVSAFIGLEQHVDLDLDGDGYAEPWIITIEEMSRSVLRIVSRVDEENQIDRTREGEIITIRPTEYFTHYKFLPSPDGGVMGIGFGVLMGPLSESVNTAINQIFDQGTMIAAGGGFLGRGVKIRGGVIAIAPGQYIRVETSGEDLVKNIVPYPLKEPSMVLFQLLGLLINYANRIPGAVDVVVGENPGQNTPAETSRNMMQMGMKIYNAIFKRTWRAMKEELKKCYLINARTMPPRVNFGDGQYALREDYLGDPNAIAPVADPHIASEAMELNQALTLKQASEVTPGYDRVAVEKRFLKALKIDNPNQVFPGPDKVPPLTNPKVQVEQFKLQAKQQELQATHMQFVAELQEKRKLIQAQIINLLAQADKAAADANGVQAGHNIAAFEAAIGALKAHDEGLKKHAETLMKGLEMMHEHSQAGTGEGGVPGVGGPSGNGGTEGPAAEMGGGGTAPTGPGVLH